MANGKQRIYALVDYEDAYVQPLILAALNTSLPPELLVLIKDISELPTPQSKVFQWRQYESIDVDHLLQNSTTSLANSYIIRKALIRKHYLSRTISHWLAKHPGSVLGRCWKQGVEFEVDYAEFLDDALDEAEAGGDLRESWGRNALLDDGGKEWWILKPGMSERGQGIRLFSSEDELKAIFEEWDPPSDDDDDDDDDEGAAHSSDEKGAANGLPSDHQTNGTANGILTSQLRHFVAQPYIHPPLLLPAPHPCAGRKFHIRTYVLAVGALKVYVYKPMLALFSAKPYTTPSASTSIHDADELARHLTNTCLQSTGEREGCVCAFWDLPSHLPHLRSGEVDDWRQSVFNQICKITAELFEATARSMSTHFQALPNSFEVFGLDFLVDAQAGVWVLEVNAFPDFAQTGEELKAVVKGLVEGVVEVGVKPFLRLRREGIEGAGGKEMVEVLDIDLGRR